MKRPDCNFVNYPSYWHRFVGVCIIVFSTIQPSPLVAGQKTASSDEFLIAEYEPNDNVSAERPEGSQEFSGYGTLLFADRQVDRVVQYVLNRHPEIQEKEAEIRRQWGLRNQATRRPNPIFGYVGNEINVEGKAGQQGMFLTQEFVTAGKLEIACEIGTWRMRAANEELEVAKLRLAQRVQRQYWSVVAARKRVRLQSQLEELLKQAIEINETLLAAGEGTRGTLLQAKLEQSQVAVARKQAEIDLRAKTVALSTTLGVDPDWINEIGEDPWPEWDVESWHSPFDTASGHHQAEYLVSIDPQPDLQVLLSPELSQLRAEIEASRWEVVLARSQIVGNIHSTTTVQYEDITNDVILGFQVGAALPIRDRKIGLIQAAESVVAQQQATLQSRLRDLEIRWTRALQNYKSAQEMTVTINQELLALAEERLKLANQAYREGEIDYLDLLTAQRSYISVQQTALDAHEQAAQAWAILQTLAVEDRE